MLDAFRRRLGDDAFLRACRRFYEKIEGRSVGTSDFRAHWREVLGDEIAAVSLARLARGRSDPARVIREHRPLEVK